MNGTNSTTGYFEELIPQLSTEKETAIYKSSEPMVSSDEVGFRNKFPAPYRTMDGHYVRSRAEMCIDNWLFMYGVSHIFERELPVKEECYCDFYLPVCDIYIEYWEGNENDKKYSANKKRKLGIYNKYGLRLIQLTKDHLYNLDDMIPKLLLAYDVKIR